MSADEWRPCPRCHQSIKKTFEKHKNSSDTPLNHKDITTLKTLKNTLKKGYPRYLKNTDIEKSDLINIKDKLRQSGKYNTTPKFPIGGNLRPVEIRYEYGITTEKAWFHITGVCHNCGYKYEASSK